MGGVTPHIHDGWGTLRERSRHVPCKYIYLYLTNISTTLQNTNNGYSTSTYMPATRALVRASFDGDAD